MDDYYHQPPLFWWRHLHDRKKLEHGPTTCKWYEMKKKNMNTPFPDLFSNWLEYYSISPKTQLKTEFFEVNRKGKILQYVFQLA